MFRCTLLLVGLLTLVYPIMALACERPKDFDARGELLRRARTLEKPTFPRDRDRSPRNAGRPRQRLGGLRPPFIANQGQVDGRVAYYAPTFAGTLFVTRDGELVYALRGPASDRPRPASETSRRRAHTTGSTVRLSETFVGGQAAPSAQAPTATRVDDYRGSEPARWRSGLHTYEQVALGEVWPGISVALHARGGSVEKVYTVRPGASADRIRMRVAGADALRVTDAGELVARTGAGEVTFSTPIAFQERDGARRPVQVAYARHGREYGFTLGPHDPTLPLVIDPLLQSTYLGGSCDDILNGIAIHPTTHDVYVVGATDIPDFPASGTPPVFFGTGGFADVFVARFNSTLTTLHQVTFIGGEGDDDGFAVAVHPTSGDVYVAGFTNSEDFPQTTGGAQPTIGVGCGCSGDGFVARLDSTLTTLFQATYLGGGDIDEANALAIHPTNGIYVAGDTDSLDFPGVSPLSDIPGDGDGFQTTHAGSVDAFVSRLSADLTILRRSTYLGGSFEDWGFALAVHLASGGVYVAGFTDSASDFPGTAGGAQPDYGGDLYDGFVALLSANLGGLTQATFLGGANTDVIASIALHPTTGDVYVTGSTDSDSDFPGLTPASTIPGTGVGAQTNFGGNVDGFVARLNSTLTTLIQSTYLGGSSVDQAKAVAISQFTGDVYVAGATASEDFPATAGGAQPAFGGGDTDLFLVRLPRELTSITQATYLGGSGDEGIDPFALFPSFLGLGGLGLAISPNPGEVYVATIVSFDDGSTFPGTAGGAQPNFGEGGLTDGVIARLTFSLAAVDPAVPALSTWLQIVAAALLLATGLLVLRRRAAAS